MSTTAVQSHQRLDLATPPSAPNTPTSRHYTSTHSSPPRGAYNAHQQNTSASSSRRPSRKHSGNGASNSTRSPNHSHPDLTVPMTSLATMASPGPVTAPSPDYQSSSSGRRRNIPPIAPPRTSSTNHNGSVDSGNSRWTTHELEKATASSRHAQPGDSPHITTNGNMEPSAGESQHSGSRSRRHQQIAQEPPQRSSSTREGRTGGVTTVPVRTAPPQPATSRQQADTSSRATPHSDQDEPRRKHRADEAQPSSPRATDDGAPSPTAAPAEHAEQRRGGRSRHDRSGKRDKNTKFAEYILGNVIGEGEFGKVRLGWKQDDGVQVAIKIIKKESLGNNPARLGKIHREVNILKGLSHPNIVHLHDMIGDDSRIGIVLEYASGGELFDYILNHRYLKDNAARRLFAQLISGVGYLHKKGIVHRDLKLENLLLDRNRNIIITDFGFANIFDARDELTEEEELNLGDREFVKGRALDKVKTNGTRRGDLMQTSCGSPCYAAPELVVSDSLYTGRKVDVWSCGVILYAMLAGYLPFDDDPANPEGDNINLLYKYIVNTPLTFPEYVSPHARDLLRRILVPNPRRRADLFEVARHSWLSEYAHVVRIITSSTTTSTDIQNTTVPAEEFGDTPGIARSASVREASKAKATAPAVVGGLSHARHGQTDLDAEAAAQARAQKEAKRRTVQVEYVAPITQTQRGEVATAPGGKARGRSSSQGPGETPQSPPRDKPLPRDPPVSKDAYSKSSKGPPSAHRNQNLQNSAPTRPSRDTRAISDNAYMTTAAGASGGRPHTGGSGRASYGQPAPPAVAGTNVHGRIQQPAASDDHDSQAGAVSGVPSKFARVTGYTSEGAEIKGHKRSSTIGDLGSKILGRSGSLFGRKRSEAQGDKSKKYPPVSMSNSMTTGDEQARPSIDSRGSRRSFSFGLGRKRSGSISHHSQEKQTRRFSLIPASFSLKAIGLGKESPPPERYSEQHLPMQESNRRFEERGPTNERTPIFDSMQETRYQSDEPSSSPARQRHTSVQYEKPRPNAIPPYLQREAVLNTESDSSVENLHKRHPSGAPYQGGVFSHSEGYDGRRIGSGRTGRGVLQKNKRFTDAYDEENRGHEGSSGAARRVMDFFRRRGKARGGEER